MSAGSELPVIEVQKVAVFGAFEEEVEVMDAGGGGDGGGNGAPGVGAAGGGDGEGAQEGAVGGIKVEFDGGAVSG